MENMRNKKWIETTKKYVLDEFLQNRNIFLNEKWREGTVLRVEGIVLENRDICYLKSNLT